MSGRGARCAEIADSLPVLPCWDWASSSGSSSCGPAFLRRQRCRPECLGSATASPTPWLETSVFSAAMPTRPRVRTSTRVRVSLIRISAGAAIETLCEQMRTPEYRSECWYTLADELAQAEASPDPATLVELCARSTMARNYHCQDHVLYFLHSEEVARAFCSLTVRARDREGCFARMGQGFSVRAGGAFSAAKARCAQFLPRSAADACVEGAAFSFGMGLTGEERFARCAELGDRAG